VEKVRHFIESKNGVENLHDLHIWAMSTTQIALTAHLVMPNGNDDNFITSLQNELKKKFNIGHTTFQIENRNLQQSCDTDC
jgi:cobalt-zinc-cadmium efflux system protein